MIKRRNGLPITLIFLLFLNTTCFHQSPNEHDQKKRNNEESKKDSNQTNLQISNKDSQPPIKESTFIQDQIILSIPYRYEIASEKVSNKINKKWKAIYKNATGQYQVGSVNFHIQHTPEEPCSGLPTETVIPEIPVLLFLNLPEIKETVIDTIALENHRLLPGQRLKFSMNNKEFHLLADGKNFMRDENDRSYFLKLGQANDGYDTLFLQQDYDDTETQILFIADLDADGLPDFVLNSPRHYEEERIIIVLSKTRKVYEGYSSFDC